MSEFGCPNCLACDSRVLRTTFDGEAVIRERSCTVCRKKYLTIEYWFRNYPSHAPALPVAPAQPHPSTTL